MISEITGIDYLYEIPDVLWDRIIPLLPLFRKKKKKKAGRPRMNDRKAINECHLLCSTQWLSVESTSKKSWCFKYQVHDRFQEWRKADGVFKRMWIDGLLSVYDKKTGIDWKWQSMDGVITKAPLGGKSTGPNPTDRAKSGTKRSILVDGNGVPLSVCVDAANRHYI